MIGLNEYVGDLAHVQVEHSHCRVGFKQPLTTLSNAPWLGGFQSTATGIINLKVPKQAGNDDKNSLNKTNVDKTSQQATSHSITDTFQHFFTDHQLSSDHIGLMTAASMNSFRSSFSQIGPYQLLSCVTSGLANARRAGDPADFDEFSNTTINLPAGTINIMVISNLPLTPAAQVEALQLITEAKTAACYDKEVRSQRSSLPATGTGTDVSLIATASNINPDDMFEFCGKHTRIGEEIGKGVYQAVSNSIQACLDKLAEDT